MESTIQEHQYLEQKKKIDKFQNDYNISEFNVFKIYFVDVNHLSAMDKRSLFYMEYIYILNRKQYIPSVAILGQLKTKEIVINST